MRVRASGSGSPSPTALTFAAAAAHAVHGVATARRLLDEGHRLARRELSMHTG